MVFLGRSNVGKSSLINRLLGTTGLARTSSSPGRTQSVNFYRVNESLHFVDLPGYGYAAAPESVRMTWRGMVEGFLDRWRQRIVIAVLLVDARHGPTDLDEVMKEWLGARGLPFLVMATKADKLSGNERAVAARALKGWAEGPLRVGEPLLASARTGLGVAQAWTHLDATIAASRQRT